MTDPLFFTGRTISHYRIAAMIGAGGMGEVYRATDTKLGRDVALKVIPREFTQEAQRMARFQREAQILASLNHPNIASIYGLEESAGVRALVMELVEGPTLGERIAQGSIPVEEAVPIAKQIAEALEYAHEHGIIHRDLKPANIKLTDNGKVKVLDFGLAKALQDEAPTQDMTNSPTVSIADTKAGIILGTAAYMSPEQAKGKRVDHRADIWSFGVVLFEMLTGRQLFVGETVTDIMAAVVRAEPDWTLLPARVPPRIRELLRRCLTKDEKGRLRDIGDARLDLDDPLEPAAMPTASLSKVQLGWRVLPWAMAVAAIILSLWALSHRASNETSTSVMRLEFIYPRETEPISGLQSSFALSPDGHSIAVIAVRDGVRKLYVRQLDRPDAVAVSDAPGTNAVSFSPDSKSVVFVPGNTQVTRFSLADQQRAVIASGADITGSVAWGSHEIIYSRDGALWTVPEQGGTARQLVALDAGRHEVLQSDPIILPGGRKVLFSSVTTDAGTERIESVSMDGSQRAVIMEHAGTPHWSPTGHLLFGRDGALWAAPFDPDKATVLGKAVPIIPAGVICTARSGGLGFQVSSTGTLVFVPSDFDYKRVVSVGRDGSEVPLKLPPNRYGHPRISPDGRRLLVESDNSVIETLDLARGTRAKLTATALGTNYSTWTADGQGVVFRRFNLPFWAAADGSGRFEQVPGGTINDYPSASGPTADSIIAVRIQPETSGDIFLLSINGKFPPKPLLATPAFEGGAQLSPDGRWMVYQSNESGQPEIYVRRYPAMDRSWQVSEGGGGQVRWNSNGKEIYYRGGHNMMAVAFDPRSAEPVLGKPEALFADEYDFGQSISIASYDMTHDGRFIMLRRGTHGNNLRVVLNWTEELKQILAGGGVR
ncbi:MAG: protein kinase domain-containing protein [Candidatus Sulfotelmatobacter sp.]